MAEQKKILIIEDDHFLVKMLSKTLESHSFEVLVAPNGKEGLVKAATEGVALILLDVMLPDINGFDVLETLQHDARLKAIPVIVISNLGQPEDIAQGKALGARDYLVKSDFSLDQVVEKIRKNLAS